MRWMGAAALLLGALLLFPSCLPPKAAKNFCSYTYKENLADSVSVSVLYHAPAIRAFCLDAPPSEPKNIFNLSDRGQAAFIESLEKSLGNDWRASLGKSIADAGSSGYITQRTTFSRRIVVSIANESFNPGDRIANATITITPDSASGAKFLSWDRFDNEYETVDLATLTFTGTQKAGLSLAAPASPVTNPTGGLTVEKTQSLAEQMTLKKRFYHFVGIIDNDSVVIKQEGIAGVDLTGNQVIVVQVSVPKADSQSLYTFTGFRDKNGALQPPDKVTISQRLFVPPRLHEDIKAKIQMDYVVRHVMKGNDTMTEGDDEVVFIKNKTESKEFVLIPQAILECKAWYIMNMSKDIMHIESILQDNRKEVILFSSQEEAVDMLMYLKKLTTGGKKVALSGRKLFMGCQPLDAASLGNASIVPVVF